MDLNVLGDFGFVQAGGLRTYGDNSASSLTDSAILEFRNDRGIEYLPIRDGDCVFVRRAWFDGNENLLVGFLDTSAYESRDGGTIGAGVMIAADREVTDQTLQNVRDKFKWFCSYIDEALSNSSPDDLEIFSSKPKYPQDVSLRHSGKHAIFTLPNGTENLASLITRASFELVEFVDTIIVGFGEDSRYPVLTDMEISNVATTFNEQKSRRREKRTAAIERDNRQIAAARDEVFWERTQYLKYPRPPEITREMEDYLIGLVLFVLNQRSGTKERSQEKAVEKGHDTEAKSVFDRAFGPLSSSTGKPSRFKF